MKLKVEVRGYSFQQCSDVYRRQSINLSILQLCAGGDEGKDSCSGDSGGPLIAAEQRTDDDTSNDSFSYLVGVVSFGPRVWYVLLFRCLCFMTFQF